MQAYGHDGEGFFFDMGSGIRERFPIEIVTDAQAEWFALTGEILSAAEAAERMVNMTHDENYINAVRAAATEILQVLTVGAPGLGWQWNNEFGGAQALPPESFSGANADIAKTDVADGLAILGLMTAWLAEDGRGAKLQKLRTE